MMARRWSWLLLSSALAAAAPGRPAFAQSPPPALPPEPPPPDPGEAEPPPPDDAAPPADAVAPAQAPGPGTFEQSLAPYGRWVTTAEYGRVWIPAGESPGWQPYTDGRWVFTSAGWSFSSTVPWGWAAFHYGRWGWRGDLGWYWVPGYVWAPAWVSWRTSPGYVGWAPQAPVGYRYPRGWPGWVAVQSAHMTFAIRTYAVPRVRIGVALRGARPGWAAAPTRLRPEYRLRTYRQPRVDDRGRHSQERHSHDEHHGRHD